MEVVAQRVFEPFYMWLDIAFLVLFIGMLVYKKKYITIIVGVLAGILYQIVDFGIFHLATGSRHLLMNGVDGTESQLFWVLMWMSMSYGFTNFAWIWLWISKDKGPLLSSAGGFAARFLQRPSALIIMRLQSGVKQAHITAGWHLSYLSAMCYYSFGICRERQRRKGSIFPGFSLSAFLFRQAGRSGSSSAVSALQISALPALM